MTATPVCSVCPERKLSSNALLVALVKKASAEPVPVEGQQQCAVDLVLQFGHEKAG
jgi:hypothetical protein